MGMTVSGSSTELKFLYRSLNPVIAWKSTVGNCQDAWTLVEEAGVTIKLVGARPGAIRKVSIGMMIYCILLEDLEIQCGKKTWKKSREETLKKKTTTITTTPIRAQQLLSLLRKNVTKDVFLSIRIMKNLPIIYHILLEGLWIVGRIKKGYLTEEKYQQQELN